MSAVIRLAAAVVRGVCDEDGPKAEVMRELAIDARREHDAAIAERDRLRAEVADLLPEADAKQHFATRALRAEERLDRMRRELEALRDQARADHALLLTCERDEGARDVADAHQSYADRITAILTGANS